MNPIYILKSPVVSPDTSLPVIYRDKLLEGVLNDGVRFIADLAFPFSYPGGAFAGRAAAAAPANGALVADIAEVADGSVVVVSGQAIGYAGGGFDFSALTARGSYLQIPASVANDIYTAYGGNSQHFLFCAYVKLPASGEWNTLGSIAPFMSFASANAAVGVPDIVSVGQANPTSLQSVRQTAGATLANNTVVIPSNYFGLFAQVAFWRNAAGVGLTIKTANGRTTSTGAVGSNNSENFSAQTGKVGVCPAYWSSSLTGQSGAKNFRVYRCFVENLARSARDPLTVLDADYARVVARGDFT
jgi:hypothetical protein